MPGTALWVDAFVCLPGFTCLPLSPFICLPLSPSLDDPVWVDGFICLPLSFVSRCLPAWMPGTALWVDGFICLPLSPRMSGTPLFPFICLPLSPSLDAWHCFLVDRFTFLPLSPFVSLYLSPVVSQPGCLARLSGWTDSFVSRCLPAWMCGTHAPRFPFCPFGGGMLGTGSSVCPSSGLRFCLGSWWVVFLVYRWLHPVCSFSASLSVAASLCPCSHLESRADESGALRCTASATRRLC